MLSLKAQPPKIGIGNGSTQFMVTFAAVQRSQNVLAKRQRIDVVEQIETPDHVVIFPKSAPRLVFTGKGAELAHDNMLGRGFQRQ